MVKKCLLIMTIFLLFLANAFAEQRIYGIYSNMDASYGEPSGFEFFFLHDGRPGKCSDTVIFQVAEGWPQYPEILDCCACSASHIEFISKKWGKFIGRIENDTLSGEFVEAKKTITIKKGASFWQKQ
jgi:hypothetical protein